MRLPSTKPARRYAARHSAAPNRLPRRIGGGVLATATALGVLAAAAPALATGHGRASGRVVTAAPRGWMHAVQLPGQVVVRGAAYDPAAPSRAVTVRIYVDGRYVRSVAATRHSHRFDRRHHLAGRHGYLTRIAWPRTARRVSVRTVGTRPHRRPVLLASHAVSRPAVDRAASGAAGARILSVARRYVGHARYVAGGSTPSRGFDCSGYTAWAYARAGVARLPHNAEAQRHVRGMHRIAAAAARPGDLVFYLAGRNAYHVAIYAGRHRQYSAATPRDGIRYQAIWSRDVVYATDWH